MPISSVKKYLLSSFTIALIFCQLQIIAQEKKLSQYNITLYGKKDGLPVNSLGRITQDAIGYIWICSAEGLIRFNGKEFKVYNEKNGLWVSNIIDVAGDSENNLWFTVYSNTLGKFKGGQFTRIDSLCDVPLKQIKLLHFDREKILWISTEDGLIRHEDNYCKTYTTKDGLQGDNIWGVAKDENSNLYVINHTTGIDKLSGGTISNIHTKHTFRRIFKLRNKKIIVSSNTNKLFQIIEDKIVPFMPDILPSEYRISHTHLDKNNNFWFFSPWVGIVKYNGIYFDTLSAEKGFPEKQIKELKTILEDREGNMWFSGNHGLLKISESNTIPFGTIEGFGQAVKTVCADIKDVIYASQRKTIIKIDSSGRHKIELSDSLRSEINTLFPSKSGGIWGGTMWGELFYFSKDSYKYYILPEEFGIPYKVHDRGKNNEIFAIIEGNNGDIWLSLSFGRVVKFDGKNFKLFKVPGLRYSIRSLEASQDGSIWVGTSGDGLFRIENDELKKIRGSSNWITKGIISLYEDNESVLWIGTISEGLLKFSDAAFKRYTLRDGLQSNRVFAIQEDSKSYLWISCNQGVYRLPKEDFNAYDRGVIPKLEIDFYNHIDSNRNSDMFGLYQPVSWRTQKNELFFSTADGIVKFEPDRMIKNSVIPPVIIEKVVPNQNLGRTQFPSDSTLVFFEDERNLQFYFAALSYTKPQKIQYKYKLVGLDDEWVETSVDQSASYRNIPPGTYTFAVQASNNDKVWNKLGASIQFVVKPYWYETSLFYTLLILSLFSALFIAYRVRIWQIEQRNVQLEKVVRERTFEVVEKNKKIEYQANQLLENDKQKSRFFANISHEFRTPLTLILSPLQDLLETKRYPELDDRFNLMKRNGNRLLKMVNQLLELSRLEGKQTSLHITRLSLNQFLSVIIASFESKAQRKNIRLLYEDKSQGSNVFIDKDKLEMVINNLIGNAIKFTPEGGEVKITTGSIEQNKTVFIRVSDSGIGISPENQEKVFDRFFQVAENYSKDGEQGTGIGLSLVKELVELHGGHIELASEVGKGSVFKIILDTGKAHLDEREDVLFTNDEVTKPSVKSSTSKSATNSEDLVGGIGEKQPAKSTKHIERILVVEDNAEMRSYISQLLSSQYLTEAAENGHEALLALEKHIPSIIISDVMMPEMDGYELCKRIRNDERFSHLPVILLTAKADKKSMLEGLEDGADYYLNKPFNKEELLLIVENLLKKRDMLHHYIKSNPAILHSGELISGLRKSDQEFIQRIVETIHDMIEGKTFEEFGVIELADELSRSSGDLNRKLKGLLGKTTTEFLRSIRLQKAADMLVKGGNVNEVAHHIGFSNLSYFAKVFREAYGVNPSNYVDHLKHLKK